ncbi:MAG: 16S rRNA (uracil(1498)-N(3))-methyltransferase [Candidatus Pacebacteria bacterium]|nr:16S rRNA (uracil(1498)-N(3))-methyltransferase [Candidatus Paceibacterota bacterium]
MKLHRFIGDFNLSQKTVEITDFQIIKQIRAVLRLSAGDTVILSDGKGREAEVILELVSNDKVTGAISNVSESKESGRKVNLYLAILKKENFELAVQKAVEAGVKNIIPVITERTVKTGLNTERLEKIIREASEQCGRSIVPTLFPILEFEDAVRDGSEADEKIIFHLSEQAYAPDKKASTASILIGPEGGFTDAEVIRAKEVGYTPASLGPLTFRGETAAIIATYRAVSGI